MFSSSVLWFLHVDIQWIPQYTSCCWNNSWKCENVYLNLIFFIQFITVESFTLNQQIQIHCWLSNVHVKAVISCYRFQNVYCKRSISAESTSEAVCNVCWALSPLVLCHIQSLSLFCDPNDYLDLVIYIIMIESFWNTKSVFWDIQFFILRCWLFQDTTSFQVSYFCHSNESFWLCLSELLSPYF